MACHCLTQPICTYQGFALVDQHYVWTEVGPLDCVIRLEKCSITRETDHPMQLEVNPHRIILSAHRLARTHQSCGDTGSSSSGMDMCGGPAADLKFSSPVRAIVKHDRPNATVIPKPIACQFFQQFVHNRVLNTEYKVWLLARSYLAPR